MNLGAPSGIGDVSWLFSKLVHVRDHITSVQIADGWPHRTHEYVKLAGFNSAHYGPFTYTTIVGNMDLRGYERTGLVTWADLLARKDESLVLVECNRWLEAGRRIETWMPDLPTEFHYPLYTSATDVAKAERLLAKAGVASPSVGISCASYRGSEAWKTWGRAEWLDCLRRIMAEGWYPVLIGGFWDDLTATVADELDLPCIVGKTSVAECVEVLRRLDALVTFSSGLNVIRTVLDKPVFALWPDHQVELSTSWAPPDMLETYRYVAHLWRPVDDTWPRMRRFLRLCDDERTRGNGHDADAAEQVSPI